MSLTVCATVYVGFEVSEADLWVTVGKRSVCKNGHPRKGDAKFCPGCGTLISETPIQRPTEGFNQLLALFEQADLQNCPRDDLRFDPLSEMSPYLVDLEPTHHDQRRLGVAVRLAEADPYGSMTVGVPDAKHKEGLALVERFRAALLGDKRRDIQLFLVLYME